VKVGSLFTGFDGLGMGLQAVFPDARPAWFVENDKAPSAVLAHRWPEVVNLGDITTIDWDAVEPIDILTGGFPCQDVSHAGGRAGMKPGTRSGLWEHFAYAIGALHPKVVIIENVRGLLSAKTADSQQVVRVGPKGGRKVEWTRLALGRVLWDLADLGYDAQWVGVRAADAAGAPHGRFRVFITAQPASYSGSGGREGSHGAQAGEPVPGGGGGADPSERSIDFGPYAPAVERWEAVIGRPAPSPTMRGKEGRPRLNPVFVEWMMGLPPGHVTDPAIGLSRAQQLKILGNGVVPQQAAAAIAHMAFGTPLGMVERSTLLPTPAVNDMGEGKTVEDWDAWTERMKAEHRNGNGHGRSLSIEAQRLAGGTESTA
jgi:DNA (cytosine-5)-methyltransferase 1